jgi:ceramide glucosyltransferase
VDSVAYLAFLLVVLIAAALAYQVLALYSLGRLFTSPLPKPLAGALPGITVFKPVKGAEAATRECLTTFVEQDYHPFEVIFGVADPADPVLPLLEELAESYPEHQISVVLCPEDQGKNPKVSILRQLEPRARYDLLVVADGDVKVGPDFLGRVAAALAEPGVGLVSCPYRSGSVQTLGAALEALTISADFIPSVAVARQVEGITFALGAALALPRSVLAKLGGFAAIADHLADDYQLGWLVHRQGLAVRLLPYVVETVNPQMSFRDYFLHQLRWTRTYRVCRPGGYLAYGITHGLVFSLILWLVSGGNYFALALVAAVAAVRGLVALVSERLCLRGSLPVAVFLLLPFKDILAFLLWVLSFSGNYVTWRGKTFRLDREGRLLEVG